MERAVEGWGAPGQVFGRLRGRWALERRVGDAPAFRGEAAFAELDERRLAYRETGLMPVDGGGAYPVQQAYVFELMLRGFAVYFSEKPLRLFHVVNLANISGVMTGDASHDAGAESWFTRYDFRPGGAFSVAHVMRGPKGTWRSETAYRRLTEG